MKSVDLFSEICPVLGFLDALIEVHCPGLLLLGKMLLLDEEGAGTAVSDQLLYVRQI